MLLNIKKNKSLIYQVVARNFAAKIDPGAKVSTKLGNNNVTPQTTPASVNIFL